MREVHAMRVPDILGVIFDLDAVLADSMRPPVGALVEAGRTQSMARGSDFYPGLARAGREAEAGGWAHQTHTAFTWTAGFPQSWGVHLDAMPHPWPKPPGTHELIRLCRETRLKLAVASNAERSQVEANLRRIDLPPESWDAIVTGENMTRKKPSPDIRLAAAQALRLRAEQCVALVDAANGVRTARAAGMRCVAVTQTFAPVRLTEAQVVRRSLAEVWLADLLGV